MQRTPDADVEDEEPTDTDFTDHAADYPDDSVPNVFDEDSPIEEFEELGDDAEEDEGEDEDNGLVSGPGQFFTTNF